MSYLQWLCDHSLDDVPTPDDHGRFWQGRVPHVLPILRAWFVEGRPTWRAETWQPLGRGFVRFLRPDQLLDLLWHQAGRDPQRMRGVLRRLVGSGGALLVPLSAGTEHRHGDFSRRVEVVRHDQATRRWSRNARWFPDELRNPVAGLDLVHTPENARAGLSRYLCDGWEVDDKGALVGSGTWGPVTAPLVWKLSSAPKRVMLAARLSERALPLVGESRGATLQAAFLGADGWNHEDAIVVSQSATLQLAARRSIALSIRVPSLVNRLELAEVGAEAHRGQALARAWIDLFALGFRQKAASQLGADEGWLEVSLPGCRSPVDGKVQGVTVSSTPTDARWRSTVQITVEGTVPLVIGDKLSTPHGIKGVVSRVLPDSDMPEVGGQRAQVLMHPAGIIRRRALGQLREAGIDDPIDPKQRWGRVTVQRQPHDARDALKTCGAKPSNHPGQRIGEQEAWALMAHGADTVLRELFSFERGTSSWLIYERPDSTDTEWDARKAATQALNRFLSGWTFIPPKRPGELYQPQIVRGQLVCRSAARTTPLECKSSAGSLARAIEALDQNEPWLNGQTLALKLHPAVQVELAERCPTAVVATLPLLPPWLRPAVDGRLHPLTLNYRRLIRAIARNDRTAVENLVSWVLRIQLGRRFGAGAFLRREVLGRRVNRSARAVIVPRPDLRLDQVALPAAVATALFEGLEDPLRDRVLVLRNPVLHRRGLLALKPVVDDSGAEVIGLPLQLLKALGADFDGDQVAVIALTSRDALDQARTLMTPGVPTLRTDEWRRSAVPAFPLSNELAAPENEGFAAAASGEDEAWRQAQAELVRARLDATNTLWGAPPDEASQVALRGLAQGMGEAEWLKQADADLATVLGASRAKGQLGGVLRRQVYRQEGVGSMLGLTSTLSALQAITERLTQSALSTKAAGGPALFDPADFFSNPKDRAGQLGTLDPTLDADGLVIHLRPEKDPTGLLAWLASPTMDELGKVMTAAPGLAAPSGGLDDPRIGWFLA